ncbi:uncharacterized protein LOC110452678 [Mizuhopecten yessoensis]|uniref:Uncharacterized protein n=1 Tax=Mizuhopecten yessoensis TaxID=6573 RepID=A0A210QJ48_MIZYE|nr:uncharacterized protein LOC110452678 [Mizuhopecten yessoensis]OWF48729.1 hypothetical protein KP79_PYT23869 [Mizuhopecten yessoensis]
MITTNMSRLMVILVLGLVASVIVARNVESEKEKKVDDVKEEDGQEEKKTMNKREANDLLEQQWKELMNQQKFDKTMKERKKEAVAEYFAEKKKKFENEFQTFEKICTCHTFKKNGVSEEKCSPEGCKVGEELSKATTEGYAA